MNENLTIGKNKLLQEYCSNKFKFLRKTKKITFRFEDKKQILNQYFIRKINLLYNIKMQDKNIIVCYLWNNLKAQLILITSLREDNNIIEIFNQRVRNNEQAIRKNQNLNKKLTNRF